MKIKSVEVRNDQDGWRKPRVYIFPPEYGVIENLENRRNRPYQEWKALIPEIIKRANKKGEMGIPVNVKARWSQRAGCSCGCSPGFILDCEPEGKEIFVELK